jgi:hypothetical protein
VKELPPGAYPWVETVWCRGENGWGCGRMYAADYRQDRNWAFCPACTGEAGRRALRVFLPQERAWYAWDEAAGCYRPEAPGRGRREP